jgi:hypothetical protein
VRQVLAQSQEPRRRELDRVTALEQRAQYQAPEIRSRFYSQKSDIRSRYGANIIALRMVGWRSDPGSI